MFSIAVVAFTHHLYDFESEVRSFKHSKQKSYGVADGVFHSRRK